MPYLSGDGGDASEGDKPCTPRFSLPAGAVQEIREMEGRAVRAGVPQVFPRCPEITDPDEQTRALQRARSSHAAQAGLFSWHRDDLHRHAAGNLLAGLPHQLAQAQGRRSSASGWHFHGRPDFYLCQDNWWPSQRPDDVIAGGGVRRRWTSAWVAGKEPVPVSRRAGRTGEVGPRPRRCHAVPPAVAEPAARCPLTSTTRPTPAQARLRRHGALLERARVRRAARCTRERKSDAYRQSDRSRGDRAPRPMPAWTSANCSTRCSTASSTSARCPRSGVRGGRAEGCPRRAAHRREPSTSWRTMRPFKYDEQHIRSAHAGHLR